MPIPLEQQAILLNNQVQLIQRFQEAAKNNSFGQDAGKNCNEWSQAIINLAIGYSKIEYGDFYDMLTAENLNKVIAAIRSINENTQLQVRIDELVAALADAQNLVASLQATIEALRADDTVQVARISELEASLAASQSLVAELQAALEAARAEAAANAGAIAAINDAIAAEDAENAPAVPVEPVI